MTCIAVFGWQISVTELSFLEGISLRNCLSGLATIYLYNYILILNFLLTFRLNVACLVEYLKCSGGFSFVRTSLTFVRSATVFVRNHWTFVRMSLTFVRIPCTFVRRLEAFVRIRALFVRMRAAAHKASKE